MLQGWNYCHDDVLYKRGIRSSLEQEPSGNLVGLIAVGPRFYPVQCTQQTGYVALRWTRHLEGNLNKFLKIRVAEVEAGIFLTAIPFLIQKGQDIMKLRCKSGSDFLPIQS